MGVTASHFLPLRLQPSEEFSLSAGSQGQPSPCPGQLATEVLRKRPPVLTKDTPKSHGGLVVRHTKPPQKHPWTLEWTQVVLKRHLNLESQDGADRRRETFSEVPIFQAGLPAAHRETRTSQLRKASHPSECSGNHRHKVPRRSRSTDLSQRPSPGVPAAGTSIS